MNSRISDFWAKRSAESASISGARRGTLGRIAGFLREHPAATLLFVCTHNSRRSQLAEVLAASAAEQAGQSARTASAGTEVTAFHPNAVAALERAGFEIAPGEGPNPVYLVTTSASADPLRCFSKRIDDPSITGRPLAAVMVCDSADAACPTVPGADSRFSLTYRDPKEADGTPDEAMVYDERCCEIAREMAFIFGLAENAGA